MEPSGITGTGALAKASAPSDSQGDLSVRWLRELERAEWRIRASPVSPGPTTASPADSTPKVADPRGTNPGSDTPSGRTARVPDAPEGGAGSTSEDIAAAGRGPQGKAVGTREPLGGAGARVALADVDPGTGEETPLSATRKWLDAASWPRTKVYVYRNEDEANVWVRDATLDRSARMRLAGELRAGLGAAGLRLGTLVVNGEVVLPAGALADGSRPGY
jgi:hypothetical protein